FDVLFSPEHGFFVWTPLAAIALASPVVSAFRRKDPPSDRRVWICLLVMVALQIYVGGSVASWTIAGGFAQRRLIALTTGMVIGLSAALAVCKPWRWAVTGLVLLAAYWNLALTAEFATGLMDRQKLEPRRNAYEAFVTLPRMAPDLVYRYFFD